MKGKLVNGISYILGCALFAVALAMFIQPNQIAPGGVSGISVTLQYVTGLSIGLWTLLLNIPLLLLAFRFIGRQYGINTLFCVVLSSVFVDLAGRFLPRYTGDKLLACIVGGAAMGAGLALVLMHGGSTGGTDIAGNLLTRRWPHIPLGRAMMMIDGVIIAFSALVFKSLDTALYSLIAVFLNTTVLDNLLYGTERGKLVYVISDKGEQIAHEVMQRLQRGCTLLNGKGAYSGVDRPVVLVAVRKRQVYPLKRLVNEVDRNAFFMVTDYTEVLGNGFKEPLI